LTILWARVFLGEGQIRERLLGASVMIVGFQGEDVTYCDEKDVTNSEE
jgi:hypothetical protein